MKRALLLRAMAHYHAAHNALVRGKASAFEQVALELNLEPDPEDLAKPDRQELIRSTVTSADVDRILAMMEGGLS